MERIKAQAFNTALIGGDDVLLRFDFPTKWEVNFSTRYISNGSTVWIDMSYEEATAFALQLLDAAKEAKHIHDEYAASQSN